MLKLKRCTIYIVILAFLSGSVGSDVVAFADENVAGTPASAPIQTNPIALGAATEALASESATFYEPREAATAVNEELDKEKQTTQTDEEIQQKVEERGKGKIPQGVYSTFQSFIVSWTLLAIAAAHNRAHIDNLQMTPENQKKLAQSLGQGWSATKNTLYNIPGGVGQVLLKKGATNSFTNLTTYLYERFAITWAKSTVVEKLFKFMVSSTMFSIGSNYVMGFIQVAAQAVLDHPASFGGTSPEERGALKLLQTRAGIAYWLSGLFGGQPPEHVTKDERIKQTFHDIDWKVLSAMDVVLLKNPDLRDALLSHLFRQSFLQGQNAIIYISSFASDLATEAWVTDQMGWLEKNSKGFGIALGVGFLAAFAPNSVKDFGTVQANSRFVDAQRYYSLAKIKLEVKTGDINQKLDSILKDETESRQTRFVKYAYLMKLALDRVDTLNLEKNQMIYLKTPAGQASVKKPQTFKEWASYIYNLGMGLDFLPDSSNVWWDNQNIDYYHGIFKTAAVRMIDIYANDSRLVGALANLDLSASSKDRLATEQRNYLQMEAFINYLTETLDQQWTASPPQSTFYPARSLLEQIAFWGIHENDIIQLLVSGSAPNH